MSAYSLLPRSTDGGRYRDRPVLRASFCQVSVMTIVLSLACGVASAQEIGHPTPEFAYVANNGDNTVSAYTIDSSTGALRAVAGSPFAAGRGPGSMTVDPSGRFV